MSDNLHHISDIDTWKVADRNKYVFLALSVLGGFIGLDHVYLRSYGTAFQKTLMNILGLGFWYFWDLIQISSEGKKVLKEGLTSPFDWKRGIGRGVFEDGFPSIKQDDQEGGDAEKAPPRKDYVIYTLLTFLGFLGANHFYLGNTAEGLVKLFMHFNIFLVLFGLIWTIYDSFNAVFRTTTILQEGVAAPGPLASFFKPTPGVIFIGGAHPELDEAQKDSKGIFQTIMELFTGFKDWFMSMIPLPPVPDFSVVTDIAKAAVPLIITPPVVKAIREIKVAEAGGDLAAAAAVGSAIGGMPASTIGGMPGLPAAAAGGLPAAAAAGLPAAAAGGLPAPPVLGMKGGARSEDMAGPGPAIAGVLAAVVLAGGLKGMYDFVNKHFA